MSMNYDVVYCELLVDNSVFNSLVSMLDCVKHFADCKAVAILFHHASHLLILEDETPISIAISKNEIKHTSSNADNETAQSSDIPDSIVQYLQNTIDNPRSILVPVTSAKMGDVARLYLIFSGDLPATYSSKQPEMVANMIAILWDAKYAEVQQKLYYIDLIKHAEVDSVIEKQKRFYEDILNSLPIDIAVFDTDHRYLFVNPGAITNPVLRNYIIGKDDFEYSAYRGRSMEIAEQRRAMFLDIKKTGKTIKWEDTQQSATGDAITHLRRFYPVYSTTGNLSMVIGFGIDITERKKLEEKQLALLNQLTVKNTQLLDFCNMISHNLRSPLGNLQLLIEMLSETNATQEQKELLSLLQPVLANMQTTIDEFVESVQVSSNTDIPLDDNNIGMCLEKILTGLRAQIIRYNVRINTDFISATHIKFPCRYLESILLNLVSNAIKYQSPKRSLSLEIKTTKSGDITTLMVADNGLGIDLEQHGDKLFKIGKVFHAHPEAKGFGLFMTKCQVEAMNGKIWIESAPDVGTTVYIEFTGQ